MNRFILVGVALGLLTSCGSFVPTAGSWDGGAVTVVSDTCTSADDTDEPDMSESGGFDLVDNGDGTFTITSDGGDDPIVMSCALSGKDFTCDPFTQTFPMSEDGSLTMVVTLTGSFSDESTMTATSTLAQSCEGGDCADMAEMIGATWPCVTTYTTSATAGAATES